MDGCGKWVYVPCTKENCINYSGYWSKSGKQRLDLLKTSCGKHQEAA